MEPNYTKNLRTSTMSKAKSESTPGTYHADSRNKRCRFNQEERLVSKFLVSTCAFRVPINHRPIPSPEQRTIQTPDRKKWKKKVLWLLSGATKQFPALRVVRQGIIG